jgi:HlyD family secretion protein
MTRIRPFLSLVAAIGLAAACGTSRPKAAEGEVFVSGRIEGDEVDLAFKANGRIREILVREGDPVEAGQVLARLDGEQEQARLREAQARLDGRRRRLEQARAGIGTLESRISTSRIAQQQAQQDAPGRVAQAEAQVEALRAELARAVADEDQIRRDAGRYRELANRGAVAEQIAEQYAARQKAAAAATAAARKQIEASEAAVTTVRATLDNPRLREAESHTLLRQIEEARAAVSLAAADVAAAEAALERAETDVAELELRAPIGGTVITRAAEPGRVVAAGAPVLTVVDLGRLYLRAYVPEKQIGRVKLDQAADVFLDSAPSTPIPATVMRIDPQGMFTPENIYFQEDRVRQVFGVKLLLHGNGAAKPGMPADARIRAVAPGQS